MLKHLFKARKLASIDLQYPCTALQVGAARNKRSPFAVLRQAMMILGVSAICTLGVMFVKPDLGDQLLAFSPFADKISVEQKAELAQFSAAVQPTEKPAEAKQEPAEEEQPAMKLIGDAAQQKWVTDWLSKRYRVASDATNMLVSAAYMTALETKLDPLLILSVIAIESRFNPFAESPMGAQGLMQVMSKVHKEKFDDHGGVKAALNPVANIKVGSQILKEYVRRGGSVEAGLKSYVGAAAHATDGGYGAKVLAEYRKLKAVASGKKVSPVATAVAQVKRPVASSVAEDDEQDAVASADEEKSEKKL